jgi:hypothetical protein
LADDADEVARAAALAVIALVEGCIADGVRAGEFRAGLDPARAARLLFAAFEGGVMLAGVTHGPHGFTAIKEDLMGIVEGWRAAGAGGRP